MRDIILMYGSNIDQMLSWTFFDLVNNFQNLQPQQLASIHNLSPPESSILGRVTIKDLQNIDADIADNTIENLIKLALSTGNILLGSI